MLRERACSYCGNSNKENVDVEIKMDGGVYQQEFA